MNNHEEYNDCKTQLELTCKIKANGIKIRSKCERYKHGEKFLKFRTVVYNDKETNDETEINNRIYSFFNYMYKETLSFSSKNSRKLSKYNVISKTYKRKK